MFLLFETFVGDCLDAEALLALILEINSQSLQPYYNGFHGLFLVPALKASPHCLILAVLRVLATSADTLQEI